MPKNITQYRIVRYAGYQGMRPSMTHQAEVERFATGKERSSQPSHLSTLTKKKMTKSKLKKFFKWRIGQINVYLASEDFTAV